MTKIIIITTIVLLIAYGIVSLSYKDGKIKFTPPLIKNNTKVIRDTIRIIEKRIDTIYRVVSVRDKSIIELERKIRYLEGSSIIVPDNIDSTFLKIFNR